MPRELMKFRRKDVVPPGGYQYQDPDTEHITVAGTFKDLIRIASTHRIANKLEVTLDFPAIVEDWICRRIPLDMTSAWESESTGSVSVLTTRTITAATNLMMREWRNKDNRKVCTPREATRRALICSECPSNQQKTACMSCQGLITWIKGWLPRSTSVDGALYICVKSAIMNVAHVHMTAATLERTIRDDNISKLPEKCWKRQLLEKEND